MSEKVWRRSTAEALRTRAFGGSDAQQAAAAATGVVPDILSSSTGRPGVYVLRKSAPELVVTKDTVRSGFRVGKPSALTSEHGSLLPDAARIVAGVAEFLSDRVRARGSDFSVQQLTKEAKAAKAIVSRTGQSRRSFDGAVIDVDNRQRRRPSGRRTTTARLARTIGHMVRPLPPGQRDGFFRAMTTSLGPSSEAVLPLLPVHGLEPMPSPPTAAAAAGAPSAPATTAAASAGEKAAGGTDQRSRAQHRAFHRHSARGQPCFALRAPPVASPVPLPSLDAPTASATPAESFLSPALLTLAQYRPPYVRASQYIKAVWLRHGLAPPSSANGLRTTGNALPDASTAARNDAANKQGGATATSNMLTPSATMPPSAAASLPTATTGMGGSVARAPPHVLHRPLNGPGVAMGFDVGQQRKLETRNRLWAVEVLRFLRTRLRELATPVAVSTRRPRPGRARASRKRPRPAHGPSSSATNGPPNKQTRLRTQPARRPHHLSQPQPPHRPQHRPQQPQRPPQTSQPAHRAPQTSQPAQRAPHTSQPAQRAPHTSQPAQRPQQHPQQAHRHRHPHASPSQSTHHVRTSDGYPTGRLPGPSPSSAHTWNAEKLRQWMYVMGLLRWQCGEGMVDLDVVCSSTASILEDAFLMTELACSSRDVRGSSGAAAPDAATGRNVRVATAAATAGNATDGTTASAPLLPARLACFLLPQLLRFLPQISTSVEATHRVIRAASLYLLASWNAAGIAGTTFADLLGTTPEPSTTANQLQDDVKQHARVALQYLLLTVPGAFIAPTSAPCPATLQWRRSPATVAAQPAMRVAARDARHASSCADAAPCKVQATTSAGRPTHASAPQPPCATSAPDGIPVIKTGVPGRPGADGTPFLGQWCPRLLHYVCSTSSGAAAAAAAAPLLQQPMLGTSWSPRRVEDACWQAEWQVRRRTMWLAVLAKGTPYFTASDAMFCLSLYPQFNTFKSFHATVFQVQPSIGCRDALGRSHNIGFRRQPSAAAAAQARYRGRHQATAATPGASRNPNKACCSHSDSVWPIDAFMDAVEAVHGRLQATDGSTTATGGPAGAGSGRRTGAWPHESQFSLPPAQLYGVRWRQAVRELCCLTVRVVCQFGVAARQWDWVDPLTSGNGGRESGPASSDSDDEVCDVHDVYSTYHGTKDAYRLSHQARIALVTTLLVAHHRYWLSRWHPYVSRSMPDNPTASSGAVPPKSASSSGAVPPKSASSSGAAPPKSASSSGAAPPKSASSSGAVPPTPASSSGAVPPTPASSNGAATAAALHPAVAHPARFPLHYPLLHFLLRFKPSTTKRAPQELSALATLFSGLVRVGVFSHDAYVQFLLACEDPSVVLAPHHAFLLVHLAVPRDAPWVLDVMESSVEAAAARAVSIEESGDAARSHLQSLQQRTQALQHIAATRARHPRRTSSTTNFLPATAVAPQSGHMARVHAQVQALFLVPSSVTAAAAAASSVAPRAAASRTAAQAATASTTTAHLTGAPGRASTAANRPVPAPSAAPSATTDVPYSAAYFHAQRTASDMVRMLSCRERFLVASWVVRTTLSRPPSFFRNTDKVALAFAIVEMCQHWETAVALVMESLHLLPSQLVLSVWLPLADKVVPLAVCGGRLRAFLAKVVEAAAATGSDAPHRMLALHAVLFRLVECFNKCINVRAVAAAAGVAVPPAMPPQVRHYVAKFAPSMRSKAATEEHSVAQVAAFTFVTRRAAFLSPSNDSIASLRAAFEQTGRRRGGDASASAKELAKRLVCCILRREVSLDVASTWGKLVWSTAPSCRDLAPAVLTAAVAAATAVSRQCRDQVRELITTGSIHAATAVGGATSAAGGVGNSGSGGHRNRRRRRASSTGHRPISGALPATNGSYTDAIAGMAAFPKAELLALCAPAIRQASKEARVALLNSLGWVLELLGRLLVFDVAAVHLTTSAAMLDSGAASGSDRGSDRISGTDGEDSDVGIPPPDTRGRHRGEDLEARLAKARQGQAVARIALDVSMLCVELTHAVHAAIRGGASAFSLMTATRAKAAVAAAAAAAAAARQQQGANNNNNSGAGHRSRSATPSVKGDTSGQRGLRAPAPAPPSVPRRSPPSVPIHRAAAAAGGGGGGVGSGSGYTAPTQSAVTAALAAAKAAAKAYRNGPRIPASTGFMTFTAFALTQARTVAYLLLHCADVTRPTKHVKEAAGVLLSILHLWLSEAARDEHSTCVLTTRLHSMTRTRAQQSPWAASLCRRLLRLLAVPSLRSHPATCPAPVHMSRIEAAHLDVEVGADAASTRTASLVCSRTVQVDPWQLLPPWTDRTTVSRLLTASNKRRKARPAYAHVQFQ